MMLSQSQRFNVLLADVWELMKLRRCWLILVMALMIINRVCGLTLPVASKYLIEDVMRQGQMRLLMPILLSMAISTLLQSLTSFGMSQILARVSQELVHDMRVRLQRHVLRLPVQFHDANKTGNLVSRIMGDVESMRNLIGAGLTDLAGGLITAAIATVLLFRTSPRLTSIVLLLVTVFGVALRCRMRRLRPMYQQRAKILGEVSGRLTETLGGVRVVKSYRAEEREASVFAAGAQRLFQSVLTVLKAQSAITFCSTVMTGLTGVLVVFLGAQEVAAGRMQIGDFIMYSALLASLISPVVQAVNVASQVSEACAALERTRQLLQEHAEDKDARRTTIVGPIEGHVRFENVSFAYNAGSPVLHDLSLDARPGTVTALIGSSGSGKSTTIGLIAAFHSATAGRVLVDGIDLASVELASYRSQLGVVLQESFLFDGTLWENVTFSNPSATDEQTLAACRAAYVDEFADKLPDRYQTIVGERGIRLSGGQKQRISIARAILADPRLLILDEATSSLDSHSEAMVQAGLARLMTGRTTFVIAHRLSTVRRADQILVMERGRIVECGTHRELYAARGHYYDLYTRQHDIESDVFLVPREWNVEAA